ncbi:MAG: hypothetical protein IJ509_01105 [Bacilli bacterium]|nr:hypothetical protein [Bacilli bacterium]
MADTKKIKTRKIRNGVEDKSVLEIKNKKKNVEKKSNSVKKVKPKKIRNVVDNKTESEVKNEKVSVKQKSASTSKKVKPKKIRMSFSKAEEQKMDKEFEKEENISIMVIVGVLAVCFIVGIVLGYFLYELALNGGI